MTWNRINPEGPTPEQLAAFVDGELPVEARQQVEQWLARHPDASREVEVWTEGTHRLGHLWGASVPPDPEPTAWDRTLERIRAALPIEGGSPRPGQIPRRWRWLPPRIVGGLMVAAALVGAVLLARPLWRLPTPNRIPNGPLVLPGPDDDDVPFPVASLPEIHIIGINPGDADAIILGHPILGTFELAAPADITELEVEPPPEDGEMARLEPGTVPMIVMAGERIDEP
jgi:hypothetical protein